MINWLNIKKNIETYQNSINCSYENNEIKITMDGHCKVLQVIPKVPNPSIMAMQDAFNYGVNDIAKKLKSKIIDELELPLVVRKMLKL